MSEITKNLGKVRPTCEGIHSMSKSYSLLSIVNDQNGKSYISKIDVPIGIEITNTNYWQPFGNSNGGGEIPTNVYKKYNFLKINELTEFSSGTEIYSAFTPILESNFLFPTIKDILIDEENNTESTILHIYKTDASDEGGYFIMYMLHDIFTGKNYIKVINIGGTTYNKEDVKVLSVKQYNLDDISSGGGEIPSDLKELYPIENVYNSSSEVPSRTTSDKKYYLVPSEDKIYVNNTSNSISVTEGQVFLILNNDNTVSEYNKGDLWTKLDTIGYTKLIGDSKTKIGKINKLISTIGNTPTSVSNITEEDVYNALHGKCLLILDSYESMTTETVIVTGFTRNPTGGGKVSGFFSLPTFQNNYKNYYIIFDFTDGVKITTGEFISSSGITDAPSDNKLYGRKNGNWSEITSAGEGITDAPTDGKTYARNNSNWIDISSNIIPLVLTTTESLVQNNKQVSFTGATQSQLKEAINNNRKIILKSSTNSEIVIITSVLNETASLYWLAGRVVNISTNRGKNNTAGIVLQVNLLADSAITGTLWLDGFDASLGEKTDIANNNGSAFAQINWLKQNSNSNIVTLSTEDFSTININTTSDGKLESVLTEEAKVKIYNGIKNNSLFLFYTNLEESKTYIILLPTVITIGDDFDSTDMMFTGSGEMWIISYSFSMVQKGNNFIITMLMGKNKYTGSKDKLLTQDITVTATIQNNLSSTEGVLGASQGKILNDKKQDKLISGTNIKSINGNSILGSGDLTIGEGLIVKATIDKLISTEPKSVVLNGIVYDDIQKIIDGEKILIINSNLGHGINTLETAYAIGFYQSQSPKLTSVILLTVVSLNNISNYTMTIDTNDKITASFTKYENTTQSNIIKGNISKLLSLTPEDEILNNVTWQNIQDVIDGNSILYITSQSSNEKETAIVTNIYKDNANNYIGNAVIISSKNIGARLVSIKFINDTSVKIDVTDNTILLGTLNENYSLGGSTSKLLEPNRFYQFNTVTSLTISLNKKTLPVLQEFMFEFTSGSTPTTLSLPEDIKWAGGNPIAVQANKTYQISIVNDLAIWGEF